MSELKTSGYGAWWCMRQPLRRDGNGNVLYREVFVDMRNGHIHAPEEGWNGEPPYPTGESVRGNIGGCDELWESLKNRPSTARLVKYSGGKAIYVFDE